MYQFIFSGIVQTETVKLFVPAFNENVTKFYATKFQSIVLSVTETQM